MSILFNYFVVLIMEYNVSAYQHDKNQIVGQKFRKSGSMCWHFFVHFLIMQIIGEGGLYQ